MNLTIDTPLIIKQTKDSYDEHIVNHNNPHQVSVDQIVGGAASQNDVRDLQNQIDVISNPNLLDNWYFINPVNRKGQNSYNTLSASGYTLDRWWNYFSQLTLSNNGLTFSTPSSSSYGSVLRQVITNPTSYAGKEVTLSVLIENVSGNFSVGLNRQQDINTNMTSLVGKSGITSGGLHSVTIKLPDDLGTGTQNLFAVTLGISIGGSCLLKAIKLELGNKQTLAHQDSSEAWILNEIPNYTEEYTKCLQYQLITGSFIGTQIVNPNLLDNWYFANPVNQRGLTTYSGNVQSIDRWYSSSSTAQLTLTENGCKFAATTSANVYFLQTLSQTLPPGSYTFSILISDLTGNGYLQCYYPDNNLTSSVRIENSGLVQLVLTTTKGLSKVLIQMNGSSSAQIVAAKLEAGRQSTLARYDSENNSWVLNEIANYGQEFTKCKQYNPNNGALITQDQVNTFYAMRDIIGSTNTPSGTNIPANGAIWLVYEN